MPSAQQAKAQADAVKQNAKQESDRIVKEAGQIKDMPSATPISSRRRRRAKPRPSRTVSRRTNSTPRHRPPSSNLRCLPDPRQEYRERSLIDCPAALRLRGPTQGVGWLRNDRASPLCRPGKASSSPGTWTAITSCSGVSYDTPFLCALRVQRFGSRVPFRPCGSERRYCEGTRTWGAEAGGGVPRPVRIVEYARARGDQVGIAILQRRFRLLRDR
ncbi:putative cell envelope integrity inner membrane protein TolA [Klebsiella variicola]|nr:putative cell envelope integrity inner membrane protein TolA [Klebsiella variicola]